MLQAKHHIYISLHTACFLCADFFFHAHIYGVCVSVPTRFKKHTTCLQFSTTHQWRRWVCPVCSGGYDLAAIEQRLVRHVNALETAYAVQDLRCVRCRQVSSKHCRAQCEFCSGELVASVPPGEQTARLQLFANISTYHNFEVLAEVVQQLTGRVS